MAVYCCLNCGESVVFYHPGTLDECTSCGAKQFHRQGLPV